MTTITFLGGEDTGDVGSVDWGRYKFVLNLPVECNDRHIIAKAHGNRFFRVEGTAAGKVKPEIVPDEPMSVKELLSGDPIPFFTFKRDAKKHLGAKMPNPPIKEAIVEALRALPLEPDNIEKIDGLSDPQS